MPLTLANIARFAVVGSMQSQDVVNIFDARVEPGVQDANREEACRQVAGDLLNQWSDHIIPLLHNTYTAEEVRWVDLDSLQGSTGAVSSTDGSDWPESGAGTAAPLSNAVYVKMVKRLEGKTRAQRNGALRLSGGLENWTLPTNGNVIDPAVALGLNGAFEMLKDGINGDIIGDRVVNLGVLHTVGGVATDFSEISNYEAASQVGTLRRRMPGYGS